MVNNNPEDIFNEIAEEANIQNAKILFVDCSSKGDGYMGDLKNVNIIGETKSLNLILKTAPKSVEMRKQAGINLAYENEIAFYNIIYPTFQLFQKERNLEAPFDSVAKCYKTSTVEFDEKLIFENLKAQGFNMWDKMLPMNDEHVTLIIKEYAKFHAVSFAMKDQESEKYEDLCSTFHDVFEHYYKDEAKQRSFQVICDKIKVKVSDSLQNKDIDNVFGKLCDEGISFFERMIETRDQYSVISHGDCWCNNMMFQYEKNSNNPINMKIIDWQLIKQASPVCDLSHFLYVCTSKDIYNNLDHYLHIYHETLSQQLENMGTDPNKVLPFNILKEQWKKYGQFGLFMALITLKIMICDSDEAPDLAKSAEGGDMFEAFNYESKHELLYQKRLNDVILHCYDNKFIENN